MQSTINQKEIYMFLAHKLIATKILFTGVVFVTAGTVLATAALTDPKCRDKLKECAAKFRNGKKNT
jgi:hypothetical protein